MARTKISEAERLKRKREAEQRRREKRRANPDLAEEDKLRRKERYIEAKRLKKVKMVVDMTEREKRRQRKAWREADRRYYAKKKASSVIEDENKPPGLERVPTEKNRQTGIKKARRNRAKVYRELATQKRLTETYKKRAQKYQKRYSRIIQMMKNQGTPRSSTKKLLRRVNSKMGKEEVRKKLLFSAVLETQLSTSLNEMTQTHKQIFVKAVKGDVLKKYRMLMAAGEVFPYRIYRSNMRRNCRTYQYERSLKKTAIARQHEVKQFLDNDDQSRMCPGKRDFVKKKNITYQKRYLNDSLINLHKKFLAQSLHKISYASFCRLKPCYIVEANVSDRDTCLCTKHENFKLIVSKLSHLGVIEEKNPTELIRSICCEIITERCLERVCPECLHKNIALKNFENTQITTLEEWMTKNQEYTKNGEKKVVKRTVKESKTFTLSSIVNRLRNKLPDFLLHVRNIQHQSDAFKYLRTRDDKELTVHIDFSENYSCKYANETQSVHFGASRQQLCLHTGVAYCGADKFSFCTVSENLRHDSLAVATHLKPILEVLMGKYPQVESLHFISDGPTQQYRNRIIFSLIGKVFPKMYSNLKNITWNYSEAGHGKGAADGIGGLVKRTADRMVKYNRDVNNLTLFLDAIQNGIKNIHIKLVQEDDFSAIEEAIKEDLIIPTVKYTMKVHQVTWARNFNQLQFNLLSCFSCITGQKCSHYTTGVSVLLPTNSEEDIPPVPSREQAVSFPVNLKPGDFVSVVQDNDWLLGIIEKVSTTITVNFLARSGNNYSWPSQTRREQILPSAVLCKLKDKPTSVSSSLMTIGNESKYIDFLFRQAMKLI